MNFCGIRRYNVQTNRVNQILISGKEVDLFIYSDKFRFHRKKNPLQDESPRRKFTFTFTKHDMFSFKYNTTISIVLLFPYIYIIYQKKKRTTSQTPRPPNSLPTTHAANFTAEHRFEKRFLPPIPRDLMAIIIFLAYHIEFMANKGRSNNRLAGPVGTEEVGPPIPRRSSAVGPGLYSRSQLAVVAIDMRAIDIWVHISQGWQVPRRALSLFPPAFLSSSSSSSSRCTRTAVLFGATRRSTTVFARPAKDRLLPNTRARELCPPFVNHLDASLIGRPSLPRREQQGGGRACTGSLRGKPLTSPLCPSAIIWPGAERMGQHATRRWG
ncbi:uncharacterized protein LOC108001176 isoform X4 [Apis cerana]|uniref:uncharacterized protein LOC108001176 isoform X4 n=1 Tax=Apis cerana TaxID=7461 RepID=UPI002B235CA2|nr:uncharacterized protein LOC108001176 isoform X4 [Apis cerana]